METNKDYDPMSDVEILKIDSPKDKVDGPYELIYKNLEEKWAIVTLEWDERSVLAIRWFWPPVGHPNSHGVPTWFVLPAALNDAILDTVFELKKQELKKFLTSQKGE